MVLREKLRASMKVKREESMQKRYELFEQEHQGSYEERRLEEDRQLEEEAELTDETDTDDEEDSEDGDELEDEEERAVKWNVRF